MGAVTDDPDERIDALELEGLNPDEYKTNDKTKDMQSTLRRYQFYLKHRYSQIRALFLLYRRIFPRVTLLVGAGLVALGIKLLFFRHPGETVYMLPHLVNHFGSIESYYDLKISEIDHWCLQGGDDGCTCQDPTDPVSNGAVPKWLNFHEKNVKKAESAPDNLDVVFLGDEFVQAWTGSLPRGKIEHHKQIEATFRKTFTREGGGDIEGIALGIGGDSTPNLLWRIHNGEIPSTLNPKVWWLLIGANDLAVQHCSEEAVILGILRVADEIKQTHPGSVVVVQGILPRSSYADGRLITPGDTSKDRKPHRKYVKAGHYPMWPSIQVINKEIEDFCARHEHLLFFDADEIFFGSVGNKYFTKQEQVLIQDLFKNDHIMPSAKGFEILAKVIAKEIFRIIYDDDEENHQATKEEEN